MKGAFLLVCIVVALGAVGLYRYESTRVVSCVSPSINAPPDTLAARLVKSECRSRREAADGKAHGIYLASAATVLLVGAVGFLVARRRRVILDANS